MMRARAASRATSVHSLAVVCTCKSAHQARWVHAYIYGCECQSGMVTSRGLVVWGIWVKERP